MGYGNRRAFAKAPRPHFRSFFFSFFSWEGRTPRPDQNLPRERVLPPILPLHSYERALSFRSHFPVREVNLTAPSQLLVWRASILGVDPFQLWHKTSMAFFSSRDRAHALPVLGRWQRRLSAIGFTYLHGIAPFLHWVSSCARTTPMYAYSSI